VELLVAISLTTLISLFTYQVFIFSNKALKNWRERIRLEDTAHILTNAMTADLMELQQLIYASEAALGFIDMNEDTIYYSQQGWQLLKNKHQPLNNPVKIDTLRFEYHRSGIKNSDNGLPISEMDFDANGLLPAAELNNLQLIRVHLTLSHGSYNFRVVTAVHVRNRHL